MEISLIAAMARNRVIGRQGNIPWRIPGEQKIFKRLTLGKALILGRGDVFFPELPLDQFALVSEERVDASIPYTFSVLRRSKPNPLMQPTGETQPAAD